MGDEATTPPATARDEHDWRWGEIVPALAIALPALGYAAAYRFELGRIRAMGLPDELVSLGLRDIVTGVIAVAFAVLIVVAVVGFFALITSGEDVSELERSLVRTGVTSAIVFVLYLGANQLSQAGWVGFAIAIVLLFVGEFAPPLVTQRKVIGLEAKLRAYRKAEIDLRPSRIGHQFGLRAELVSLVAISYLVFGLAQPVGAFTANTRSTFGVIPGTSQRVVVSEYGGAFVCLDYTPAAHIAKPPITFVQPPDLRAGLLVEHTGPLHFIPVR